MNIFNDPIRNRTHELPAVTAPPRTNVDSRRLQLIVLDVQVFL